MTDPTIAVVILAAGHGSRMESARPKVLHEIGGAPMIAHVLAAADALSPEITAVIVGDHAPAVGKYVSGTREDIKLFVQSPPQGTAHAVMQAAPALAGFAGVVVVLYADTPLVKAATLKRLISEIGAGAAVAVLGFYPETPGGYGRLKRDDSGTLAAIIEAKDASPEELDINLCNSGVMAFDAGFLNRRLPDVDANNAKQEYYLTDLVALARDDNRACAVVEADSEEVLGVNSRIELAEAESVFQNRTRADAMENGATLLDPQTVYFSHDTTLGKDVVVGQHVVFAPGVAVSDNVEIKAYSHLEGATVAEGAVIGPFARLRPGASIGPKAKIGNFVEVKKAEISDGAKVNHLSYIGDATVGAGANIGAGTITCNYDGYGKHKTVIGANAFIGSNSALVAPVTIGDGAYVGSGSVITKDVDGGDLAVARGRQAAIKGWAARFRKTHEDN
ncbi:MAG: bifunctional UDP-N-acetylglucosamine diphosphorylase/glucosamine-1-phosphate N-acetyltransferase GlmU [Hyphococcus sp.]